MIVRHCTAWGDSMGIAESDIVDQALDKIHNQYQKHKTSGIPKWEVDSSDITGGLGMETWINRCFDNHSTLVPGLNIIEGIYGRDGNGFYEGPHNGKGMDKITNFILFGKNAFNVDIIGHYLNGTQSLWPLQFI